mgnify:CR=1 FL=1
MDASRMPGDAEAAAAAAGMRETYGGDPPFTPGQDIRYRIGETGWYVGRVIAIDDLSEPIKLVVEDNEGGEWRTIDGREWPAGNVMPY